MFAAGLYPGVDYIVEQVAPDDGMITVRPSYPLVRELERDDWPVSVSAGLAPRWVGPMAYNTVTAGFAL